MKCFRIDYKKCKIQKISVVDYDDDVKSLIGDDDGVYSYPSCRTILKEWMVSRKAGWMGPAVEWWSLDTINPLYINNVIDECRLFSLCDVKDVNELIYHCRMAHIGMDPFVVSTVHQL